jgi:histidinol-phosphatase (PHP family)
MIGDMHTHTRASADGRMTPEEAIFEADRRGIMLAFTEHLDYEADSDKSFALAPALYAEQYEKFRSKGVLVGIEAGLTLNTRAAVREALRADLDMVIGSVHVVEGFDLFTTFFLQDLDLGELWRKYLSYTLLMIEKCDFFDSLGHIDYPSRYCPHESKNIEYDSYPREYDLIFQALLDSKKVLELNSARLNDPGAQKSLRAIFEGYRKSGGRFVTIGSDAHAVSDMARNFDIAYGMAKVLDLLPVFFRNRKMEAFT